MIRKKKVKKLKAVDAAYIAAMIDGEGSIMLIRAHKNEYRRIWISISNCDKKMLEWVSQKIGIGKVYSKKIYNERHMPTFFYRIDGRRSLPLLKQICPYLRTYKKERAKLILKYFLKLTPRNGKYSEKMLTKKKIFTEKFMKLNTTKRNQVLDYI